MTLPAVPATFHWTTESWGAALRCKALEAVAPHMFTTRQLRLSAPDDEEAIAAAVGARTHVMLSQVHGRHVVVIRKGTSLPDRSTSGDVLVSNRPDVAIAVRSADCVPILMADRATGAVAAVHAGWRGTAAGAAPAAVESLDREYGSRAADLIVAIGPSIGRCCYEVGPDTVDAFAAAGHGRERIDRWFAAVAQPRAAGAQRQIHLDLAGANRDQLVLAGVPEASIHICGLCTAMHLDVLTSYRAERERAGRLAAVIRSPPHT